MRTQDKIIVTFVWGLIFFEALSFLYLFATNLYKEVSLCLMQNFLLFILLIPIFIVIVSILCASYFKATTYEPGSPNYLTVLTSS